jgi:hypothetical protein
VVQPQIQSSSILINNTSLINFAGIVDISQAGQSYLGFEIGWSNACNIQISHLDAFRISGKFYMIQSNGSNYGYRRFESLITPIDNQLDMPKQLQNLESANFQTEDILTLNHDVLRISSSNIELRVKWNTVSSTYRANLQGELFASSNLGPWDIHLTTGLW